jgi:16S rRNA (cytidine1402-2'-O)-methyltransferase
VSGRLVLVATPIGNLEDFSDRARRELLEADVWLVEDTRVSGRLQSVLGVKIPMRVLNDHTGPAKLSEYVGLVGAGSNVAVISDAGTPVVSDPGSELVDACLNQGFDVDAVPGPSAVSTALCLSGYFAQRYAFLGFLGRKASQADEVLRPFADSPMTVVLFESPHRVVATLEACHRALGERNYAICRELTKLHQQVWRGRLPETPTETEVVRKGEMTIVVEGHRRNRQVDRP